ncbi:hypothetical protein BsWGS_09941 [Bradybaena similaris]
MKMMISMTFLACMASLLSTGTCGETSALSSSLMVRKNVNVLSFEEENHLKGALRRMQQDTGPCSFEYIGSIHGSPKMCKSQEQQNTTCSIHGKYTFPHWHRLYIVQYEQCLKGHGQDIGICYWDFTSPGRGLPLLVTGEDNPFSGYTVRFSDLKTVREPTEALFDSNNAEGTCLVYQLTLTVLEQRDYCSFESYIETLHNALHAMIGGTSINSLFTTTYAPFDPMFMFLHSNLDRVWAVWQELQKLRGLPYEATACDGITVHETLHPFDDPDRNSIPLTRENSFSASITDHRHLNYRYDSLAMNNHTVEELEEIIKKRHSETRVYLGQVNFVGQPLRTETFVLNDAGEEIPAGINFLMGNSLLTYWYNQPLFKFDITNAVRHAGVSLNQNIKIEVAKNTRVRFSPVSAQYNASVVDLMNNENFENCTLPQPYLPSYEVNVIHSLEPGMYYFASTNKEACDDGKRICVRVQIY